jgi:hypothetical protein
LYEGGYFKDCEKTLAEGIQKYPDTAELYYRMSGLQMELGKKQEGMAFLEHALELDYTKHTELLEYLPVLEQDLSVMELINSYKNKK